jgi:tetratricopeptide (TPR) repeat protein
MQVTKTEILREAQKHIDQGRVTAALAIYQKIVESDPTDLAAISMLGDLYLKSGRITDAVNHFVRIGENYLRNGSAISAAYILRKVLRIDPRNPQALMSLGELELQDKKMDRAHDNFIEAGAAFWNKGNIPAAIEMNKRALEIMPDSRLAKVALALIEREKQEPAPPAAQKTVTRDLLPIKELPAMVELPDILISISDGSDAVCAPGTPNNTQTQAEVQQPQAEVQQPQAEVQQPPPELQAIASSVVITAPLDSPVPISQPDMLPMPDEDAIIQQIVTAEFLVGCGQIDQAIARLRESLQETPDHIQIREKLKDIYLRSEMIERASEECVNIAGIYAARGDNNRAKEYVTRARLLLSPEPYSSPEELRAVNRQNAEEASETNAPWPADLSQAVTVM